MGGRHGQLREPDPWAAGGLGLEWPLRLQLLPSLVRLQPVRRSGALRPESRPTNLANFLRSLASPREVEQWSLTTLHDKLVKIGARIVRYGRYVVFQLAEDGRPAVGLCRDPAADRPATRIARADDMTVGGQMAEDDGRAMRKKPAGGPPDAVTQAHAAVSGRSRRWYRRRRRPSN
jgi:hypothetical protein